MRLSVEACILVWRVPTLVFPLSALAPFNDVFRWRAALGRHTHIYSCHLMSMMPFSHTNNTSFKNKSKQAGAPYKTHD